MAKKRRKTVAPVDDRTIAIVLKGTPEFVEWLDEASRRSRMPRTVIIDVALAEWAERHGHTAPPDRTKR